MDRPAIVAFSVMPPTAARCDRAVAPDEQPETSRAAGFRVSCIKDAELDWSKVNRPAIVVHLLEVHQFSREAVAQVPLGFAKGDHIIGVDALDSDMRGILGVRE